MNMKKTLAIAIVVTGIGIAGIQQASANRGFGGGGYGPCYNQGPGTAYSQVDPAIQEKLTKFRTETNDLRKQMVMKQAEKMAILRSATPDPAAAAKVEGELYDLRATMQEKAEAAGVAQYMGPGCQKGQGFGKRSMRNNGNGRGPGSGMGRY